MVGFKDKSAVFEIGNMDEAVMDNAKDEVVEAVGDGCER